MRIFGKIFILILFGPLVASAQSIPEEFLAELSAVQKSSLRLLQKQIQSSQTDTALKTIQTNLKKEFTPTQQPFLLYNLTLQNQIARKKKDSDLKSQSLETLKKWAERTEPQGTRSLQYAVRSMADNLIDDNETSTAKDLLLHLIKTPKVPSIVREQALFQMASYSRDPDNPEPSLKYVNQLLALPRIENDNFIAQALMVRVYHSFYKDPVQTEKDLLKALELLKKQKWPYNSDIANVHQHLAELYFTTADYAKILPHIEQAEIFVKKSSPLSETDKSNLLYARALKSMILQDLPRAENDLRRVTSMPPSRDMKWEYQSRLFAVIRLQGKVDESRAIYAQMLKSSDRETPPKIRCIAAFEFSLIELGLGNIPQAVEMLKEAQKYIHSKSFHGKEICQISLEAQVALAESFSPKSGNEPLERFPKLEQKFKKLYPEAATANHHLLYTPWYTALLIKGQYQEALNKIYKTQQIMKTSSAYSPMHFHLHLVDAMTKALMGQKAEAKKKIMELQTYLNLPVSKFARVSHQPQVDLVKSFIEEGKSNPEKIRKLLSQDKTHSFRFYVLRGKL